MEEYEIEYVKGIEDKVADYLSKLLPITADTKEAPFEPIPAFQQREPYLANTVSE